MNLVILPTKVHLVKPMVFPVVIYGCVVLRQPFSDLIECIDLVNYELAKFPPNLRYEGNLLAFTLEI